MQELIVGAEGEVGRQSKLGPPNKREIPLETNTEVLGNILSQAGQYSARIMKLCASGKAEMGPIT